MGSIETEHLRVEILWEVSPLGTFQSVLKNVIESLEQSLDQEWEHRLGKKAKIEFALHLIGDEKMAQLNGQYRQTMSTTDVLAFPVHENPWKSRPQELQEMPPTSLGDVMISLPQAEKQSKEHNISLPQELAHLLVHGFLHLLGFDHKIESERAVMAHWENRLVNNIYHKCGWE